MRDSEVNQINDRALITFEIARTDNYVLSLDVAMDEALVMQNFEVVHELMPDLNYCFQRKPVSRHSPKQVSKIISKFFHYDKG